MDAKEHTLTCLINMQRNEIIISPLDNTLWKGLSKFRWFVDETIKCCCELDAFGYCEGTPDGVNFSFHAPLSTRQG